MEGKSIDWKNKELNGNHSIEQKVIDRRGTKKEQGSDWIDYWYYVWSTFHFNSIIFPSILSSSLKFYFRFIQMYLIDSVIFSLNKKKIEINQENRIESKKKELNQRK